jgi:trans-aconitate methyltransferase
MDAENRQDHWQRTYQSKTEQEVSWHQDLPEPSLTLITAAASPDARIIDIGGGSSHLVDHLLQRGYRKLAVLDLSSAALARAQARIGAAAAAIDWIAADVTTWTPTHRYDVWHDRATFHFMVTEGDRSAYLARLRQALVPGGCAIIATFAPDGPERCSGLPVMRYDSQRLAAVLGQDFTLIGSERHMHRTPWNVVQPFQFGVFRRASEA